MMFALAQFGNVFDFNYIKAYSIEILALLLLMVLLHHLYNQQSYNGKIPPGPMGLPFFGYLPFLGSEPAKSLARLAKIYGDVFSFKVGRQLTTVVSDYELMKEILNNPDALDRPLDLFAPIPSVGFNNLNGEEWLSQKKFCMTSMRNLGLGKQHWEELIMNDVQQFIQDLRDTGGKPVEIETMMTLVIMGNITNLLLGKRIGNDSKEISPLLEFLDTLKGIGPYEKSRAIPYYRNILEYFRVSVYGQIKNAVDIATNVIRDEIKKHKKEKKGEDFMNLYLNEWEQKSSLDKKHYFNDINLQGNVTILLVASIDTSTSTLKWMFRLLAAYPEVQKKVQAELDEAIGREGSISYFERNRVPYTFATIMEAQRLSSVVPISTTRRANTDIMLNGHLIPKGSDIIGNIWAIHNDPKHWKNPEIFNPERFLAEDKKSYKKNPPNFAPFSVGRRNCPGETIASISIFVILISVMQKFWISMPPGVKPDFVGGSGIITHLNPQPLIYAERT